MTPLRLLLVWLLSSGCDRAAPSRSVTPSAVGRDASSSANEPEGRDAAIALAPSAASEPAPRPTANVRLRGRWQKGPVKAARATFVLQAEPCVLPRLASAWIAGSKDLERPGPFDEQYSALTGVFFRACLYGYDAAGALVGGVEWHERIFVPHGQGSASFEGLDFELRPAAVQTGPTPKEIGVLLEGEPGASARAALGNTGPVPVSDEHGGVFLTRVSAVVTEYATVKAVNDALLRVGARLSTSRSGISQVTVAIPRQWDGAGVERVAAFLEESGAFMFVHSAHEAGLRELPVRSPPRTKRPKRGR